MEKEDVIGTTLHKGRTETRVGSGEKGQASHPRESEDLKELGQHKKERHKKGLNGTEEELEQN